MRDVYPRDVEKIISQVSAWTIEQSSRLKKAREVWSEAQSQVSPSQRYARSADGEAHTLVTSA